MDWCWGPIDNSDFSKMSGGLKLLHMHSSISHLQLETALKDDNTPSDADIIQGYRPEEMRNLKVMSTFAADLISTTDILTKKVHCPPPPGHFKKRKNSSSNGASRILTTDGRNRFYGYDIERKWLMDYATTHWCWGPIDNSDFSKMSGGLKLFAYAF